MKKNELWILFGCIFLILTILPLKTNATLSQEGSHTNTPYWYTYEEYKANPLSEWIPYFSTTDIPHSQPMRGFISDSRNWFIDLGAFEWFSEWVEGVWGNRIDPLEKNISSAETDADLHNYYLKLFTHMSQRLTTMGLSINYAADLLAPFNAWVPLIVIDNLTNNGYSDSELENWVIQPDLVLNGIADALPIVDWNSDVYWYDYYNETDTMHNFSLIADNYIDNIGGKNYLTVEGNFLDNTDDFINNIVTTKLIEESKQYDLIFPSILFLLENTTLYYPGFGPIGGLGQIDSYTSVYSFWNLNGRNQFSYFFGGNPDSPRDSLTSTVIHEAGHTIGLPHPHEPNNFYSNSWILDTTTISTMTYYSRSVQYDRLEKDLVLNGIVLQLMGRYLDEIAYFEEEDLNTTQQTIIDDLELKITDIPDLLIDSNIELLKLTLFEIDSKFADLATELGISRKSSSFTEVGPKLDVKLDFIIGPGIEVSEPLLNLLQKELQHSSILYLNANTDLPIPNYELNKEVFVASDSYKNDLKAEWFSLLKEDNTSLFDLESIPETAWESYPRNQIFQTQSGYSLDAEACEDWLTENPATIDAEGAIHYRFYLFNLDSIVEESNDYQSNVNTSTDNTDSSIYGLSYEILILTLFPVSFYFKKIKK